MILFYLIWLKTVSKGTLTEEVRIYIWKIDRKDNMCLENQASLDNELCRLCHFSPPRLMIEFRNIRRCKWLSLDKSIGEFALYVTAAMLMVKNKSMSLLWELISIFM